MPTRARTTRDRLRAAAPVLVVVLVALLNVTLHVRTYTLVGPMDELQHIDYLYKSPSLVRGGDRIGQDAMREEACRGLDYQPFALPACSTEDVYEPTQFQENGYNTAAVNTPVYYTATRLLGTVVMAVTPVDNLVTAGRLVGGLWLALGLALTYAAARRLGAHPWVAAALLVVVATLPGVVYPSSTIGPDAATLAVGGGVLLATLWWQDRPGRRWPVLAAVSALALTVKLTNLTLLVALGLYLLVRLVGALRTRDRRTARGWLVGILTLGVTAAVVGGGWLLLQKGLTYGDPQDIPMNARFTVSSLAPESLLTPWGTWLVPLQQWAPVGDPGLSAVLKSLGTFLLPAGLAAAALLGSPRPGTRAAAWSLVVVGALGPSAFVLFTYLLQHSVWPPPVRYGYSLVPAMVVLTAVAVRDRGPRWALLAVAAAAAVLSVLRLLL